jgi:DNA-binding CsgD family transcriptional regulator
MSSREDEVVHLIYHQLTPQERSVHEYTFGLNGKPRLEPGAIAKKLKMDNSKVSKLRTSIFKKMEPHLE